MRTRPRTLTGQLAVYFGVSKQVVRDTFVTALVAVSVGIVLVVALVAR